MTRERIEGSEKYYCLSICVDFCLIIPFFVSYLLSFHLCSRTMPRLRRFYFTDEEIVQLANAADSDPDERAFELDDKDIAFHEQDTAKNRNRNRLCSC